MMHKTIITPVAWAALLLTMAAAPTLAWAGQPPVEPAAAEEPVTELEEIEVIGRRELISVVEAFVDEVAAPSPRRGLARWTHSICVGTVNIRRETAQYMIDRVSDLARELGLGARAPGCRPHILIIGASDGRAMAQALAESRPAVFRAGASGSDRGRGAFQAFQASDAPVRWWHSSMPTDSDTGAPVARLPGGDAPLILVHTYSGRRAQIRDDLRRVIVIVDFEQASGATLGQLADYVAMGALAQIDPDADTSAYPSILNLFGADAPPEGMTAWDRAYLDMLYEAHNERILPHLQARAIARVLTTSPEGEND